MHRKIKICYIGGGSKLWARIFMTDLALSEGLSGEIALYDIDVPMAKLNEKIGNDLKNHPKTKSKFDYKVYENLDDAMKDSDFVLISILPGTFKEMRSDVHTPEKYGIYQSVGDTVGPGGVLRAMRTVPIYEGFAKKLKEIVPNAWVINFTNPMSICTKTLFDVFPEIKAFGCCHEVFHAQELLTVALKELRGIEVERHDIYTDASGVNHFTWITEAKYQNIDLLALLPEFIEKFGEEGYFERKGQDRFAFKYDPFAYGNKVKFDLYQKYGALAAGGDRHLAEFINNKWYLKDPETVRDYQFMLTTVDFREKQFQERIDDMKLMASGQKEYDLTPSGEEAAELIKALLGFGTVVSNVNMPNKGQMRQMPLGSIVETNCVFSNDYVAPVVSKDLPLNVCNLVYRSCVNIDATYEGIKERDLEKIYLAFANQPLCGSLTMDESYELFKEMCYNTREYLDPYFDLDSYFNK